MSITKLLQVVADNLKAVGHVYLSLGNKQLDDISNHNSIMSNYSTFRLLVTGNKCASMQTDVHSGILISQKSGCMVKGVFFFFLLNMKYLVVSSLVKPGHHTIFISVR